MEKIPNDNIQEESLPEISHRKLRNSKRETELEYATLSLEEASKLDSDSFNKLIKQEFGEKAKLEIYSFKDVKEFLENPDLNYIVLMIVQMDSNSNEIWEDTKYITLKKIGGRVVITPAPLVHDIFLGSKKEPFKDVLGVLEEGFVVNEKRTPGRFDDNAIVKGYENHVFNFDDDGVFSKEGITKGDSYSISLYPDEGKGKSNTWGFAEKGFGYLYWLKSAKPERILSVNIRFISGLSEKEKEEKMKFYKEKITDKYGVAVRFYETEGIIEEKTYEHGYPPVKVIKNREPKKRILPNN